MRLNKPEVESELKQAGIQLIEGQLLTSARRLQSGDITSTRAFHEGRVTIQNEASQLVALLVGQGLKILDCCAAPGGKTRVMAHRNPDATILATELHPHRAQLLRKLVPEANVEVITEDILKLPIDSYDRVLADVPCSGTGTLAHNPEIKWRLKPEDLTDLHQRQVAILKGAMQQIAPGGKLVYSTCSLEPEENAEVVEEALRNAPQFRLTDCKFELEKLRDAGEIAWRDLNSLTAGPYLRTFPGVHPCDGFFAAILQRD